MSKKEFPIEQVLAVSTRHNFVSDMATKDLPIVEHLLGKKIDVDITSEKSCINAEKELDGAERMLHKQFPWIAELKMPPITTVLASTEFRKICAHCVAAAKAEYGESLLVEGGNQKRSRLNI
ncbi:MAG TPA: hypothetical protein VGZ00_07025 [Candidatus Baltobacteraceae bacterium]|jgi:hypothetical protein|nr:hypothetical protein [Candidatus Baltobacteraceae bacterium]